MILVLGCFKNLCEFNLIPNLIGRVLEKYNGIFPPYIKEIMFYIKSNPNPAADGNYRELLSVVLNTLDPLDSSSALIVEIC